MQIRQVEIEFGMTQNLGDYSNTRPSVKLVAELNEGDDVQAAIDELTLRATTTVHNLVDDELERHDKEVIYHTGPLYQVKYSDLRKCVVLFTNVELPIERTWKEADSWSWSRNGYLSRMRYETAKSHAERIAHEKGYVLVYASLPYDLQRYLPPLPDPGPEPMWHKKQLESHLRRLNINESDWEELAALDHVNDNFLYQVNDWRNDWKNRHRYSAIDLLNIIRTGALPDQQPTPDDEGIDEEEDYEDTDE